MRKPIYLLIFSIILVTLIVVTISCKSTTITATDESAIRTYADPATETTLQGLSEDNLAKYTQYGNPAFNAAVTQAILDTTAAQITKQYGAYVSKEFLRIEMKDGYTVVHYKAKYSKGNAGIRMVFDKDNLVTGQWFE